jgi:bifunctional non-homologous end joining protein LigD
VTSSTNLRGVHSLLIRDAGQPDAPAESGCYGWWPKPCGDANRNGVGPDDSTHARHRLSLLVMSSTISELRRRVRAEQSLPRFEPCLPRSASEPPTGPGWIHEIKHDGFRILAQRKGRAVRLITRNGNDLSDRFPLAAAAMEALPVRSCVVDGEAIVCDSNGLAIFNLIRGHGTNALAVLCAFDLLEVNGEDVRREPVEDRKRRLAELLSLPHEAIATSETFSGNSATILKAACALGCEGIVSKRLGSPYRSGRSAHWLKIKNPAAPAVKREAEDWS